MFGVFVKFDDALLDVSKRVRDEARLVGNSRGFLLITHTQKNLALECSLRRPLL